jgi:signal transduction histidine kinase
LHPEGVYSLGLSASAVDTLLERVPAGVVIAEAPGGRILHLNAQALRLSGLPRSAFEAESAADYPRLWDCRLPNGAPYPPDDLPLVCALRGETVTDVELLIRPPGGAERTLLVSATPLRDAPGDAPSAAAVVFLDVSARLRLEGELSVRSRQMQAAVADAKQRVEELHALRELGRAMVSVLEQDRLLDLVVEQAVELTGASGGLIARADWEGGSLTVQPARGRMEALAGERFPLRGSLVELVILDGAPLLSNDLEAMPRDSVVRTLARRLGLTNILLVPLQVLGESHGVLGVVDREGGFDDDQRRSLESFADYAALALHNAQLYALERRRAEENRALLGAAEALTSTLDAEEILERIVELARELVGADGAGITIVDELDPTHAHTKLATGLLRPYLGARGPLAGTFTEEVIRAGEPLVFNRGAGWRRRTMKMLDELGIAHLAALPLSVGDEVYGVLGVVNREEGKAFTNRDLRVLSLLSNQAALSVRNARLFEATQSANRAKSEFLAIMSHELRTPLNALEGYAALLEEGIYGPLNPEQQHALGRMRASRSHLLALIDQVLDVSRAEASQAVLRTEQIDLAALAVEIGEALQGAAEARRLRLEVEPGPPVPVESDPAMVRQIITNLVGNAIKFTDEGRIVLRCARNERSVRFQVEDSGPGIPPAARERVFEPFVQLDASTTRREGGSGLGLALSRKFARMLGGEIELASETEGPARGCRFTLVLPFTQRL